MTIEIIGSVDKNRLYCAGSFSKLLTTFITLTLLSEKYTLTEILDDEDFFDRIAVNEEARDFLDIFQQTIGSRFTLHDVCSFYTGMPYTFNVSAEEIESVDAGNPYKHHCLLNKETFINDCKHEITQVYPNRSKFNYSELSIIFLGYFFEKVYATTFEELYQKYVINRFNLTDSYFSRMRIERAYTQDLSDSYDLASIAVRDHGYFCYSNGFYTTLSDTKKLLESLLQSPVFQLMTDVSIARAASNRLMNGLTVELRVHEDDLIIGYDGLSYSGCNLWAYSTKQKKGYLTFNDNGDLADQIIFQRLGYDAFDKVPPHSQQYYHAFLAGYDFSKLQYKDLPQAFEGNYHRVRINNYVLNVIFPVTVHTIEFTHDDKVKYDIVYVDDVYRIKAKDGIAGDMIGLHVAKSNNKYISYGGVLLKKMD